MSDTAPNPPVSALRNLIPFLSPHRSLFVFWLAALALSSSATLALPVAVKNMIDEGFHRGQSIDRWFLLLMAVAVLMAAATALRFYFVSLLAERVIADLRRSLFANLLSLDVTFFQRTRSGELLSRLSSDTQLLRSVVVSSMSVALRSCITLLGCSVMLALTSPRLALYALLGIPLVMLPIALSGRRVRVVAKDSQNRVADAIARASETLGAMHTVQSFVRESFERERFSMALRLSLAASRKRIHLQAMLTATVVILVFGSITAVLWIGAKDVIAGNLTPGTLGQFLLYAIIGAGSVGSLSEVWAEMQRAAGGMSRINDLLQKRSTLSVPTVPASLASPVRGRVTFEGVRFHYPSRPDTAALDDFNLIIEPGDTVALVGPSGAGKSTVFQMLMRFYDPSLGKITLDGVDIRQLDPTCLRECFALVPQEPIIFCASARDNIRYGRLEASDAMIEASARSAEAHEFVSALPNGYCSELGERGARLSGGQKQRLAIARALLKDAPVLLLDEATSALDAKNEQAVQQGLLRLMQGRTTLVIAHRLSTVLMADRIVVMDRGRIIAQGNHAELLAQGGLYADLARLQFSH